MNEIKEEWRPVVGYEGLYEVSNLGRVKSLGRWVNHNRGGKSFKKGKILKQNLYDGYYNLTLTDLMGKRSLSKVHRLVAKAFLPNSNDKLEIDHINTIRTDNRVENLRWATHKENMNNPITKKKNKLGSEKPILQYFITDLENPIAWWDSLNECSRFTGIGASCISDALHGRIKVISKEFYFKYAE